MIPLPLFQRNIAHPCHQQCQHEKPQTCEQHCTRAEQTHVVVRLRDLLLLLHHCSPGLGQDLGLLHAVRHGSCRGQRSLTCQCSAACCDRRRHGSLTCQHSTAFVCFCCSCGLCHSC